MTIRNIYKLLFVAALVSGCSADVVPIYMPDTSLKMEKQFIVGIAVEEYFGMAVRWRTGPWGAVTLDVHHVDLTIEDNAGREWDSFGCKRYAWSHPAPNLVAHELAHALGLDGHSCEPDDGDPCTEEDKENLMHPFVLGDTLTDSQLDIIEANAAALNFCAP